MDFVDLHLHLLPGLDDGPATITDSLRLLARAYDQGTRRLVATPHMFLEPFNNSDVSAVTQHFTSLLSQLSEQATDPKYKFLNELEYYLGSENYLSVEFLEALGTESLLTLNDSRYLLLEFSPVLHFSQIEPALIRILNAGYIPLLAHAERMALFQRQPEALAHCLAMGCLSQVNSGSLLGLGGTQSQNAVRLMLHRGLVHVIASDGHSANRRPPLMKDAFELLSSWFDEKTLEDWFVVNPQRILLDEPLGLALLD